MSFDLETDLIILEIAIGLFIIIYNVLIYFRTKVPIIITPKMFIKNLLADSYFLKIAEGAVIYEMGSGWGDFSFAAEKLNPKKITAFELSPIHLYYSRLKAKFKGARINFFMADFFKADISDADLFYVFLVPKVVERLWQKIKKECRPGTLMILLGHELQNEIYFKKIETSPRKNKKDYYYFYKT
jgi:ribosomal protein L11 methylase PrmA